MCSLVTRLMTAAQQKGWHQMGMAAPGTLDAQKSTTPTRRAISYRPRRLAYLRARREKFELSQRALAAKVGLTHSGVSRLERGLGGASPEVAAAWAEALEEPLEELFEKAPRSPRSPGRG